MRTKETNEIRSERLARRFHEYYEEMAPAFGYETREASKKPWPEVPETNRRLMTAVCRRILQEMDAASLNNVVYP